MIEIQTFFLAKSINKVGEGSNYNGQLVGAHNFFPLDDSFPFSFRIPHFMLLRRDTRDGDESFTLYFNLIDQDGQSIGQPKEVKASGMFPSGHKFMILAGTIEFLFPSAGDYSLAIIADEDKLPSTFMYDIEVTPLSV